MSEPHTPQPRTLSSTSPSLGAGVSNASIWNRRGSSRVADRISFVLSWSEKGRNGGYGAGEVMQVSGRGPPEASPLSPLPTPPTLPHRERGTQLKRLLP